jgi:hypothetical protein
VGAVVGDVSRTAADLEQAPNPATTIAKANKNAPLTLSLCLIAPYLLIES